MPFAERITDTDVPSGTGVADIRTEADHLKLFPVIGVRVGIVCESDGHI